MAIHESHEDVLRRLKRLRGHLTKCIEMIESGRPCLAVAQQLRAVVSALVGAKNVYLQDHIEHCLVEAVSGSEPNARKRAEEFRKIVKYL